LYIFSSVNEQSDDTGAVSSTTATSSVSAVNVVGVVDKKGHVDSPNLLTFGLSKKTLGQLGFKFKEDLSVAGPAGSRPIEEKKGKCELDSKLGISIFRFTSLVVIWIVLFLTL